MILRCAGREKPCIKETPQFSLLLAIILVWFESAGLGILSLPTSLAFGNCLFFS